MDSLRTLLDGIEKRHLKQREILGAPTPLELDLLLLQQKESEQRRLAQTVFERVMDVGAEQFGLEWLKIHRVIADEVQASYLPARSGAADERMKALAAEIAYAVLSQYKLVSKNAAAVSAEKGAG